ncbi:PrsW family intramembrane metalloprotease [Variovorax sp. E3]|uniref:PrsW family intramembrane metalloprotease n=1 Tax=Variovorax sp. E3 TaxID=1914993 RepID=UPI0022B7450A|nr:PrsW family glutamic-type intramembrane protease [Variovorax sp. E3]
MSAPVFDKSEDQAAWPVGTDSFFQPQRAAFWLLSALILNGLFYTVHMFSIGFRVVPITAFLGLLVWGLYTLLFLLAFRTLDLLEQHPPEAFVLAFAWGGMGAVYFAAPANIAIQSLCAKLISPEFVAVWGPAIAGPITEEFLKIAGVILLVLVARNQFQTYLSVLIVGALTGLGFQVIENLSYTVNASMHFPLENQVYPVFLNLFTRGLMSGLWSHAPTRRSRPSAWPGSCCIRSGRWCCGWPPRCFASRSHGACTSSGTRRSSKTCSTTATAKWPCCWWSRAFRW